MTPRESTPPDWDEISDPSLLTEPAVSVVMPVYNHAPYLAEAIEGVLGQQADFAFELLIGDDASRDGSLEIAREYQRRHPDKVRIVTSDANVGMHANFERLVEAARAPLLAFCEGDDYWHRADKLALQADLLRSHGWGAVHSDFTHIRFQRGEWRALEGYWRRHRRPIPSGSVFERLLSGNFIQTCSLMANTEAVRAFLASDLPWRTYSVVDWPLCLFISASAQVGFVDESLATYRLVPGSATNSGQRRNLARAVDSVRMIQDFAQWGRANGVVLEQAQASLMTDILVASVLCGNRSELARARLWFAERPSDVLDGRSRIRKLARHPLLLGAYLRLHRHTRWLKGPGQYSRRPEGPASAGQRG